ncbi:NAD-dependent epimerase/dehydratase family protein [Occultella gossypii]|uniref:NAD(P)-dependent oxidoreductase n=1 Tax=Occultella gossypii TaxID=2800820 RepID=A0ABS7S4M1_9MICO|nr:NAD(P)-dependent oxidoreductase [Occultella gossypii]MBZ2195289.1 NAD(P)-dependent oxidoreductase [Occultella gossypii]
MHIFLAGGAGIVGTRLIPALVRAGHDVTATTRRTERLDVLHDLGARGVVVDVLDAPHLAETVAAAEPELVMHQLTDLGEYDTEANARLRRDGTANLVAAAEAAGVDRMIAQSIAFAYAPGDTTATEDDPLEPGSAVGTLEALVHRLPRATVLRYGMFYGDGTWYAPGGRIAGAVAAGQLPATPTITPFVHIEDVVSATVQALDWPDGTYNIVDDEPASGTVWLPVYASGLGAPAPRVAGLPDAAPRRRTVSNAKARAVGWRPGYPSWRDGFPTL